MDRDTESELKLIEADMMCSCWVEFLYAWRDVCDSPDVPHEAKQLATRSMRKMADELMQMTGEMKAMVEDASCL